MFKKPSASASDFSVSNDYFIQKLQRFFDLSKYLIANDCRVAFFNAADESAKFGKPPKSSESDKPQRVIFKIRDGKCFIKQEESEEREANFEDSQEWQKSLQEAIFANFINVVLTGIKTKKFAQIKKALSYLSAEEKYEVLNNRKIYHQGKGKELTLSQLAQIEPGCEELEGLFLINGAIVSPDQSLKIQHALASEKIKSHGRSKKSSPNRLPILDESGVIAKTRSYVTERELEDGSVEVVGHSSPLFLYKQKPKRSQLERVFAASSKEKSASLVDLREKQDEENPKRPSSSLAVTTESSLEDKDKTPPTCTK